MQSCETALSILEVEKTGLQSDIDTISDYIELLQAIYKKDILGEEVEEFLNPESFNFIEDKSVSHLNSREAKKLFRQILKYVHPDKLTTKDNSTLLTLASKIIADVNIYRSFGDVESLQKLADILSRDEVDSLQKSNVLEPINLLDYCRDRVKSIKREIAVLKREREELIQIEESENGEMITLLSLFNVSTVDELEEIYQANSEEFRERIISYYNGG
jgi:hypothetical protein